MGTAPAHLRCASCNGMAVDAMRLPCCDQSVCLACCQHLQTQYCPVRCYRAHAAARARPNKDLRSAVANFFLQTGIDVRGLQAGATATPPQSFSVQILNLIPSTNAADIVSFVAKMGAEVAYCKLLWGYPTMSAEVVCWTRLGAEAVVRILNGKNVRSTLNIAVSS